jgi:hypothetical protein
MHMGYLGILCFSWTLAMLTACGKNPKGPDDLEEDATPLSTGTGDGSKSAASRFYAFSLTSLYDALIKAASASSLTLGIPQANPSLGLADEQSSRYPRCSGNGEPWDVSTNQVMSPAARDYPQLAFYCQFHSNDTDQTVRGALERNKRLLCDLERVTNGISYTAEGTFYEGVALDPTEACGWSPDAAASLKLRGLKAKMTATAMTTGNWPQRLKMEIPGYYNVTLLLRVEGSVISVKELESWTQDDYGRDNEYVPGNAQGVSGHLVTMDTSSGLIQAEIGDTYWGLRARVLGQGTLDPTTGLLKDLKATKAVLARFDKAGPEGASYLNALVTGMVTDTASRTVYTTASYTCAAGTECNVNHDGFETVTRLTPGARTCIADTGTCDMATGILWTKEPRVLSFLKIGSSWDDQNGTRGMFQDWLLTSQTVKIGDDMFDLTLE